MEKFISISTEHGHNMNQAFYSLLLCFLKALSPWLYHCYLLFSQSHSAFCPDLVPYLHLFSPFSTFYFLFMYSYSTQRFYHCRQILDWNTLLIEKSG